MDGKRVVSEWLKVNPSLLMLPYRAELERLIDERLRAVEEEHKDVEWWSVWALEHDWLPPHDAQRLTAEREEPVFKAALDIARRWREDGTENAVADILAERDRLAAEVARLRTRSALQAADYTALETRERALVGALKSGCSGCKADYPLTPKGVHRTPRKSFFLCSLKENQRVALAPTPRQEGA